MRAKLPLMMLVLALFTLTAGACAMEGNVSGSMRATAPPKDSAKQEETAAPAIDEQEWIKFDEIAPPILVKAGDEKIPYKVGLNVWDGMVYERASVFDMLLDADSGVAISSAKPGSTVTVSVQGGAPDYIQMMQYAMAEDGEILRTETLTVEMTEGTCSFALPAIGDGTYALYGFSLVCRFADNECEYGFILRPAEA